MRRSSPRSRPRVLLKRRGTVSFLEEKKQKTLWGEGDWLRMKAYLAAAFRPMTTQDPPAFARSRRCASPAGRPRVPLKRRGTFSFLEEKKQKTLRGERDWLRMTAYLAAAFRPTTTKKRRPVFHDTAASPRQRQKSAVPNLIFFCFFSSKKKRRPVFHDTTVPPRQRQNSAAPNLIFFCFFSSKKKRRPVFHDTAASPAAASE